MKTIKLTESDLEKIVKKVLKEQLALPTVNKGNRGDEVIKIQQELVSKGYDLGNSGQNNNGVDGKFGPKTQKAVKEFQIRMKLNPTGKIDQQTRNYLFMGSTQGLFGTPKTLTKQNKEKITTPENKSKDSILSTNIDTEFQNKFKLSTLSDKDSTFVCKAGQENCGQFVNDFSKKLSYVGNAWLAHDSDQVGKRVMSYYTSLNPQQVEKIFNIFKQIEKQGGPKERKSGGQVENIKSLQQELIKPVSSSNLKVDDIVGIYYPASGHHEEAFHQAGKPYFVSDGKGGWKKGNTISSGKGFGLNTHVGIVGAVKNGVPLIFHNISGDVYSDPYDKLRGGGKIAWIKRN